MGIPPEAPGLVLLAVAAVLAPGRAARLLGVAVVAIAFGMASARVALALAPVSVLAPASLLGLPVSSRVVDGGAALGGLLAAILALPAALRRASQTMQWTRALLILGGVVMCADATTDLARSAGAFWPLVGAMGWGALGALIFWVTGNWRWAEMAGRIRALVAGTPTVRPPDALAWWWISLAVAGVAGALWAPHALVITAAVALATIGVHAAFRRMGAVAAVPLLPLAVIPLLGFTSYFLWVIAGPVGLSVSHFADVPLSSAAQVALAPPLLLAALFCCGPLVGRRWLPGAALALAGVALLLRLGQPLLGEAMVGWETLFLPIGVVLLWLPVLAGDWEAACGIGAWMAASVVAPAAVEGGWCLAVAATFLAIHRHVVASRARVAVSLRLGAAGFGAVGVACGIAAVLQHQVVYGVLAVLAVLLLVAGTATSSAVIYSSGSPDSIAHSGAFHDIRASSTSL